MSVDEVGRVAVRGTEPAPRSPTAQPLAGVALETPVFGRRPETLRSEGSAPDDTGGQRGRERELRPGFQPVEYPDPSPSLPPPPVPITELPRPVAAEGDRDATAAELRPEPRSAAGDAAPEAERQPADGGGAGRPRARPGLAEADALARATLARDAGGEPIRPVDPTLAGARLDARA